jgi:hypothetical protein
MNFLSERLGWIREQDVLTLYIKSSVKEDEMNLRIMKIWVILWIATGLILVWQGVLEPNIQIRIYLLVFLVFWAYYAIRVLKAYYFKKYGYEILRIQNGQVLYRKDIKHWKGKPMIYRISGKKPFKTVDNKSGFLQVYFDSFLSGAVGNVGAGEGKNLFRFGIHLNENDSEKLLRFLNKNWNDRANEH